jgi:uncharacterized protein (TIGR00255 family)
MICSMTAFARLEDRGDWGVLVWEIRSLNHRYLEVNTRLPEDLRTLESGVRDRAGRVLSRGKVECSLRYQRASGATAELALNRDMAARLIELSKEINEMSGSAGSVSAMDLLVWPGVVQEPEPDLGPVSDAALKLFDQALNELVVTRRREGERMRVIIEQRCEAMEVLAAQVKTRLPDIRAAMRERLDTRLAEIDAKVEPGRLEQELVIQLQKMDVDEELDRLEAHLQEVRDVLSRTEPVGRRLDFLMQELNREANTLGSKSSVVETTRAAVELKVLIEQVREQVQNIE